MKKLRAVLFNTLFIQGVLLMCLFPLIFLFNTFPSYLEAYNNFFGGEATTSYIMITKRVVLMTPFIMIVLYLFQDKLYK